MCGTERQHFSLFYFCTILVPSPKHLRTCSASSVSTFVPISQPRTYLPSMASFYPGSALQQRLPPFTTPHFPSSQPSQPAQKQPLHTPSRLLNTMGIPLWPQKPARWPGSHLPRHQWPRGMHLDDAGNPIYPPGVTCKQLGEEPPYFPVTSLFWVFSVLATLLYLIWPVYVMWRFLRTVC